MIEAIELRIGNWVNQKVDVGKCGPIQLIPLKWNLQSFYMSSDDLEPIPLTPEILEKCGSARGNDVGVWLTKVHNKDKYFVNGFRAGHTIQYLHEYQNVCFALTGEELSVKNLMAENDYPVNVGA